MNHVALVGRLTADPAVNGSVTGFTVAVKRDFKNQNGEYESDFPRCKAFGKTGEIVQKHFTKGDLVEIGGRIATGRWTDKQTGEVKYSTDVMVDRIRKLAGASSAPAVDAQTGFQEAQDDDELPFK